MSQNTVTVIQNGYCNPGEDGKSFTADCTVTLVKSQESGYILVDTSGPWNKTKLINDLTSHNVSPTDIATVVCTHGHSDHIGNLNIFSEATKLIVGFDISYRNIYEDFDFKVNSIYNLSDSIYVLATPGHMHNDVSLVVKNTNHGTVVVAGDLFENEEDLSDESLWKSNSEDPEMQEKNRSKVLRIADVIIPGHGPMFFTAKYKKLQTV